MESNMPYTGVCVGGPLAGQTIEHGYYVYRTQMQESAPKVKATEANGPATTTINIFEYRHLAFASNTETIGVWIPEAWGTLQAIQFLAEHYSRTCQK